MNEQGNTENRIRYFACKPPSCSHNQVLTVKAAEAERIKGNPQYHDAKDPVKTYAFDCFSEKFKIGGASSYSFHELPQETGDRMQVMSDVLSGRVAIEDLKAAEDASQ